jgi:7-cyano-7-deazaguanine synthase in queuosine biosynthesis
MFTFTNKNRYGKRHNKKFKHDEKCPKKFNLSRFPKSLDKENFPQHTQQALTATSNSSPNCRMIENMSYTMKSNRNLLISIAFSRLEEKKRDPGCLLRCLGSVVSAIAEKI